MIDLDWNGIRERLVQSLFADTWSRRIGAIGDAVIRWWEHLPTWLQLFKLIDLVFLVGLLMWWGGGLWDGATAAVSQSSLPGWLMASIVAGAVMVGVGLTPLLGLDWAGDLYWLLTGRKRVK
ncbi:MAG: hypothetical protein HYY25_01090 [Candidatus Wallbacteria bacterium]|nr:hypothetical protein [Candidatus Wallbacteria bacterium]